MHDISMETATMPPTPTLADFPEIRRLFNFRAIKYLSYAAAGCFAFSQALSIYNTGSLYVPGLAPLILLPLISAPRITELLLKKALSKLSMQTIAAEHSPWHGDIFAARVASPLPSQMAYERIARYLAECKLPIYGDTGHPFSYGNGVIMEARIQESSQLGATVTLLELSRHNSGGRAKDLVARLTA